MAATRLTQTASTSTWSVQSALPGGETEED
jgi:hypothetical protein